MVDVWSVLALGLLCAVYCAVDALCCWPEQAVRQRLR